MDYYNQPVKKGKMINFMGFVLSLITTVIGILTLMTSFSLNCENHEKYKGHSRKLSYFLLAVSALLYVLMFFTK